MYTVVYRDEYNKRFERIQNSLKKTIELKCYDIHIIFSLIIINKLILKF